MGPCFVDAHCHVSTVVDTVGSDEVRNGMGTLLVETDVRRCVMSTNAYDWEILGSLAGLDGAGSGCFAASLGVHPWYCHLYSFDRAVGKEEHYRSVLKSKDDAELVEVIRQLPDPIDLLGYMSEEQVSRVACIGEIGLDKVFRLPKNGFLNSVGASLGNVRVEFKHQVRVFEAMLDVAKRHDLPVSIHSVKCQGTLFDICKEILLNSKVNVCLHSFTGTHDSLRLWLTTFPHERLFFSVSAWINLKDIDAGVETLKHLPLECILTETDCTVDRIPLQEQRQMIGSVLDAIATAHGISKNTAEETVLQNFHRFLRR
ncbi:unnamed protein product [Kluyveromyces dobzhanskii CBS 2104]|uniref:WGS project CCBQ000000000 data, contig 00014 n=1 Tax=Kluyveromyces dobzhanskii CBS 2104 TaxID=1427455 RepID=A0A0A8L6L2_9SACH|nr:unnamed protein product [Kluyveromyces dobzhanskii CBS 2104]